MRWMLILLAGCGLSGTPESEHPCGSRSGAACLAAAEDLVQSDRAGGLELLQDACERLRDGPACEGLGRQLIGRGDPRAGEEQTGVRSPFGIGAAALESGCRLDQGSSCYELGRLTLRGVGLPGGEARAREWFGRACALGEAEGCLDLGILLENGRGGEASPVEARGRFVRACQLESGRGCTKLGLSLQQGLGSAPDPMAGLMQLERGCELEFAAGCGLAAMALAGSEGVEADPSRRLRLLVAGVHLEDPKAARLLEEELARLEPLQTAELWTELRGACAEDEAQSCRVLGVLADRGEEPLEARTALRKACEGKAEAACGHLARLEEVSIVAQAGLEALAVLHERGCNGAVSRSCLWLGRAYTTGEGVEQPDPEASLRHYRAACLSGAPEGCRAVEAQDKP